MQGNNCPLDYPLVLGCVCRPCCLWSIGQDVSVLDHCILIWASSWEKVSLGVSDQVRLKLACSATGASRRLEILVTETRDIIPSRQRTTKALIRLRGCAGWSAPLLFAFNIRHVLSWPGPILLSLPFWNSFSCCKGRVVTKQMNNLSQRLPMRHLLESDLLCITNHESYETPSFKYYLFII